MFLNEVDIRDSIRSLFSNSKKIDCAVAFVGEKALDFIQDNSEVKMICNLESGGTNPYTIQKLIERNVDIRTNPSLHAKVFIGDDKTIIGSANLSANGLGFEGDEITGWIEAGVFIDNEGVITEIKNWFDDLWEGSFEITDSKIEDAIKKWEKRRYRRAFNIDINNQSFFELVEENPDVFKDRNIFFAIHPDEDASDEAYQAYENDRENYPDNTSFYENWDVPDDAWLIDISYSNDNTPSNITIWKTPEQPILITFESGKIKLCFKEESIDGIKLKECDKDKICNNFSKLIQNTKDGYDVISLLDGVSIMNQ